MNNFLKAAVLSLSAAALVLPTFGTAQAGDHDDAWAAGAVGLVTGTLIGGAIASQPRYSEPVYIDPEPEYYEQRPVYQPRPVYRARPAYRQVVVDSYDLEPWTRPGTAIARSATAPSMRRAAPLSVMTAAAISALPLIAAPFERKTRASREARVFSCPYFRSEPAQIRVGATLLADSATRSVAANEADVVTEWKDLVADGIEELLMIAARQVGAADRAVEQHVADMGKILRAIEIDDVAGAWPGQCSTSKT